MDIRFRQSNARNLYFLWKIMFDLQFTLRTERRVSERSTTEQCGNVLKTHWTVAPFYQSIAPMKITWMAVGCPVNTSHDRIHLMIPHSLSPHSNNESNDRISDGSTWWHMAIEVATSALSPCDKIFKSPMFCDSNHGHLAGWSMAFHPPHFKE